MENAAHFVNPYFYHRREKNVISKISHDFEMHFDTIFLFKCIYHKQYDSRKYLLRK